MAAVIAARQHGVAELSQLLGAGLSRSAIYRHARSGRLVRKYVGVYAVGHDHLTVQGEWMAAVLAGGPGAVLSHRSAAAAWGLRPDRRNAIDITVAGKRGARQVGLTVHECRLAPEDVTEVDGIPVTTVSRTLLDLAEVVPRHHLVAALRRTLELRVYDQRTMDATLARAKGRRGQRPLRIAIAELPGEVSGTKRELEAAMAALIRRERLPRPVANTIVEGHDVDMLWRAARLVVELDSWTYHGTRPAFEHDRERDADLLLAGYRVLRVTHGQVTREPQRVAARLRALLGATG